CLRKLGRSAISPPAIRSHSGWNCATTRFEVIGSVLKFRYVAGSTAATLIACSSILPWAGLNRAVAVTPWMWRIRRTIRSLNGWLRKIRMSAVCSGAWNGPGRSTACSSAVGLVEGSALGVMEEAVGLDEGLLGSADALAEPSPQPAARRAGSTQAATAAARR